MKLLIYFFLFLFLAQGVNAMGIGTAPSQLNFELEQDQSQKRELTVYNLKQEPSKMNIESKNSFLKFHYGESALIGPNSQKKVIVEFDASNLESKNYSGTIYFSLSKNSEKMGVEVGTAVNFNAEVKEKEVSDNIILPIFLVGLGFIFLALGIILLNS